MLDTNLDSYGSAPGRDNILQRNGCDVSKGTKMWSAQYPACQEYVGCPAAFPVVWCPLPGAGHNNSSYNGTNYSPGGMWQFFSSLPPAH
jgi:hypothetical protein